MAIYIREASLINPRIDAALIALMIVTSIVLEELYPRVGYCIFMAGAGIAVWLIRFLIEYSTGKPVNEELISLIRNTYNKDGDGQHEISMLQMGLRYPFAPSFLFMLIGPTMIMAATIFYLSAGIYVIAGMAVGVAISRKARTLRQKSLEKQKLADIIAGKE